MDPPPSPAGLPLRSSQTPTSNPSRATSASDILAAFSPRYHREQSIASSRSTIPSSDPLNDSPIIIMERPRKLRAKPQVTYEISSDSDDELAPSVTESAFSSPPQSEKRGSIINLTSDEDELSRPSTPPPRRSSAGHALRQPKELHRSLRAEENADKPRKRRRMLFTAPQAIIKPSRSRATTERNEIRQHISSETKRKRDNFLADQKEIFLPLLPAQNYLQRLISDRMRQNNTGETPSIPYQSLKNQPEGVKATMKPYQLQGLSFLVYMHKNAASGILGDEMGLGKTLQTLSLLQHLKNERQSLHSTPRPSLVVCPLSVLSSWISEAQKFTPDLKIIRFHGPPSERDRLKVAIARGVSPNGNRGNNSQQQGKSQDFADVVVTTYEGFLTEQAWLKRAVLWNYVILDEGHKIKNDGTLISKALQGLGAEHRLIITGTPLQNNLHELWALLHFLYPEIFTPPTSELFKASFNLTKGQVNTNVMEHARRLLEVVMLRRLKNSPGVNLDLPPKTEVLLYSPLTPMQRFWYLRLLTRADQGLLDDIFQGAVEKEAATLAEQSSESPLAQANPAESEVRDNNDSVKSDAEWKESKEILRQAVDREKIDQGNGSAWRRLMNIVMQLRKCCNHPYTLPNAAPDPYYLGEHIIQASAKMILLDKILKELVLKKKKKILIFSGFTQMLDCCEDLLCLRGGDGKSFKYARLDGGTSRARRNLAIRMFNQDGSAYQVMLISTKAGGLGINLATATEVILTDQEWNPQITLQAESRAHRIGQKNLVTIYKLCTQGTIEEQMLGRIQKKLYLSAKVTENFRDIHSAGSSKMSEDSLGREDDNAESDMPQLSTNELISLVRRGAQTLAHPEIDVNEMLSWDWQTTLDKCRDRPADLQVSKDTQVNTAVLEEDERKWLAQIEHVQSRVFEGKKLSKSKQSDSYGKIAEEWSRESRRAGMNTTVMVDGFAVSKESLNCGEWEAVPTLAGKDPRLAEPVREKKAAINNQDHCQKCWDGGDLLMCSLCPRSFHFHCLDRDSQRRSKSKMAWSCPQHQCADCNQKTQEAGGMLLRCRCCERALCEDCLNWDEADLLGENLKEYEMLGFPMMAQAFYIKCPACVEHHSEDEADRLSWEEKEAMIHAEYEEWVQQGEAAEVARSESSELSPAPSLDDDETTRDCSGLVTPSGVFSESETGRKSSREKRKGSMDDATALPSKRSKRFLSLSAPKIQP